MKEEILKFFRGEAEDSPEVLEKYSKDASIFEVRPKLVLYPLDSDDVVNLVEWVSANKEKYPDLSITCRAAGTDMSGGAIGESIILDFTRHMNKLVSFFRHEITVEPAMYYRAAGERTLKYGKTEDYIMETKIVFADGVERKVAPIPISEISQKDEIYKKIYELIKKNEAEIKLAKPAVHKNSAGYYLWNVVKDATFDLNKLLVGSQGTLGIATQITFRLVPSTRYSKLVVIFRRDLEPLGRLVGEILALSPETLEAYDDKTLWLAVRVFREFVKNRSFLGALKFLWSFRPEFGMMFRGGFPHLVPLAEFSGVDGEDGRTHAEALARRIKNFKAEIHITENEAEAEKYWSVRRESFNLLRKHIKGKRTAPFIDDIVVRPEFLPKFLPALNQILKKYK